jgi:DNA polymerase I-like protein with 3'-5' exonuclease and polymerase domains
LDILVIDFETYYAKDFGFNKLTTEEYVRDSRFEVIGVAVKKNDEETQWFSGTTKNIKTFLDQFDWENGAAVAHNAKFDMAVLNWVFDIRPKKIIDTLSMARAIHTVEVGGSLAALSEYYNLGNKGTEVHEAIGKRRLDFSPSELRSYGGYCIQDVELTAKLFMILMQRFSVFELDLIDLTLRMFTEPVLVLDKKILKEHLEGIHQRKKELMEKVIHDEKDLRSSAKFAALLAEFGVEAPMKLSPTTGKETYAFAKTDEEFKALQEHENEYVQLLVAARLGVKSTIEETRTERFISIADRGLLPIPLRYYAAHTGRWGGDDKINMQNLPRGSQLKKAMRAPEGYVFIDCDLSQIEARTLAWLAQQHNLVAAFENGDDVYKIMASSIYGKPTNEISKDERFVGKTTILGAGYGMGPNKFQQQLKNFGVELDLRECERIIKVYRKTYKKIPELWYQAGDALEAMMRNRTAPLGLKGVLNVMGTQGIEMPNKLRIQYANLRKQKGEDGKDELVYDTRRGRAVIPNRIYGGKVIENVCQALARIVIGEQLLRIAKKYKVVMTVHDAIGCIAPEAEADEAMRFVEESMKVRPTWALDLPLDCEGGYAKSYGEC